MKKVTGVGGVFFKSSKPKSSRDWYAKHLGFDTNEYGCTFQFREKDSPDSIGNLQWSPFKADTDYFSPSEKEFMVNFRVDDLEALAEELRKEGVTICDEIAVYEYGKFLHIMDNDGNKIELWEPIDEAL